MESVQGRIIASRGGDVSENHPAVGSLSSSSTHSDEISTSSDVSQAIPHALIREQWQLVLGQEAGMIDLQNAIELCRKLVLDYEEGSTERKWIVRHLVELRFRLREIQDVAEDPTGAATPAARVVLGHHFVTGQLNVTTKQYCDHCTGIIWSVVQASYICSDCSFCVHHKCLSSVLRVCAHVVATERKIPVEEICPEAGLSGQKYKCAECSIPLTFTSKSSSFMHESFACFGMKKPLRLEEIPWTEARLCDYSGLHFCPTCHWNNTSPIPARIVHNWDFTPKRVARASLQELLLLHDKPVINLEELNPKLFSFVQKLAHIKKIRSDLHHMKKYLTECRLAAGDKLMDALSGARRYLLQTPQMYSVADLVAVETGTLLEFLTKIFDTFERHIRHCQICSGKGYLCEVCGNNEVIFPFDDCSMPCRKCNSIYHRVCWLRKNQTCIKCIRLEQRRSRDAEMPQGIPDDPDLS
ncbi:differentially expressed in FDCP 8 homolog isoform X1 [Lutzomyia longipalpis]|uniref:differentially expressed in FDCP 8 homolog isoform X1 n=1 Tax=Lutzomyia longipalpis TaxID=7200 RepID=UPI002483A2BA|nr:differentially expressed in FDCP 8 homolog isoform X1 [Lutzomyia longipalpis]